MPGTRHCAFRDETIIGHQLNCAEMFSSSAIDVLYHLRGRDLLTCAGDGILCRNTCIRLGTVSGGVVTGHLIVLHGAASLTRAMGLSSVFSLS